MIDIYSKALQQTIQVDRIINQVTGKETGPTLIFFAGIHGNEPAGVFALQEVLTSIEEQKSLLKGTVIGITGNMKALSNGIRYVDTDLNRMWTSNGVMKNTNEENYAEKEEQHELMKEISKVIKENTGPFYFFDLHTTSGATPPFITINDTFLNRKFALQFHVPVILGIEEFLSGPLLSYINEWGYVSLGYESGQHDEPNAIKNHKQFIIKALQLTGLLPNSKIKTPARADNFYEITYRYHLETEDQFSMCNGFKNFQPIAKGQHLASHNGNWVDAMEDGVIFMPLYQQQGNDGFFLIRKIPLFFLKLSRLIREARLDNWLTYLPGIKWKDDHKTTIQVNEKIARFFASDFLHLMGYRVKHREDHYLVATKRENRIAGKAYKHEPWVKNS
ncbi:MAG: succinylglutamate desuccinylase/aspartoacylase family protein [Cyclobacteriaceae bacterium]